MPRFVKGKYFKGTLVKKHKRFLSSAEKKKLKSKSILRPITQEEITDAIRAFNKGGGIITMLPDEIVPPENEVRYSTLSHKDYLYDA